MDETSEPSLYLGQAKLVERRPITSKELRGLRKSLQGALSRLGLYGVALLVAYSCAYVAHTSFSVPVEIAVVSAALYTVVALGAFLLVGRDWLLTVKRVRAIRTSSEVLKFVSEQSVQPRTYIVAAPAHLLIATHLGPEPVPFPVEPTEVAPVPSRTGSVLDWMESVNVKRATRLLEATEKQEIQRRIARMRVRFAWWEILLLIWSLGAIVSVVVGASPSTGHTIMRVFVFVSIWGAEIFHLAKVIRARRMLRACQTVGMVGVMRHQDSYAEVLLPHLAPWSLDGVPARWRRA